MKKQKYRFNEDKLLRNIAIISTIITGAILIHKISVLGLSCLTTIYK